MQRPPRYQKAMTVEFSDRPQPAAVVLDIGNVLIDWQPEAFFDRRMPAEARARMFEEADLQGMNLQVDRGADLHATVMATAERHPRWAPMIRLWHDCWLEMASPAITESVQVMMALRRRDVPVFALSNFGISPFEMARRAYPFLDAFDRRWISGHLGLVKPEPEIYARLEAQSGVAPERLLFTDDRADNIAAAQARGWQTHLFTTPRNLAARLHAAGLLSEEETRA